MKRIVITGEKGGIGKSTLAALITEYLNFLNKKVNVIDADPLQVTQTYLNCCFKNGRDVNNKLDFEYQIIDTPGCSGPSSSYIQQADLILVPFLSQFADCQIIIPWFANQHPRIQKKVVFIPNRWQNTLEQRDGLNQIEDLTKNENAGKISEHFLSHRPTVYGTVLNGNKDNFFINKESSEQSFKLITSLLNTIQDNNG